MGFCQVPPEQIQGPVCHQIFVSLGAGCARLHVAGLIQKVEEGQLQTSTCSYVEFYDNLITKASCPLLKGIGTSDQREGEKEGGILVSSHGKNLAKLTIIWNPK